ncbi:hypothetical protein A8H39_00125 [Paraburkholderia fungorum]|uniref:hypothetical protein n=1 Tax=Paraburkholderia fungorum TaxID=134537 RepID=UPI00048475DF|nr:hypothetical protein [Paraburkholderia fungorum]PNE59592.1 hypothetical protein A8H39_00125 [Paraburkholderia fungorum]
MTRNRIIQSPFAHHVNHQWYLSSHAVPAADTIKAYREQVRQAYGNLRGVRFAAQGIDYSHFVLQGGVLDPVKMSHDIGCMLKYWTLANQPIGYQYPVQDSPVQVRLVREDGKAGIRLRLYDVRGSKGMFTRLGAYVNEDSDSKHTIDIPLSEDGSLEKAVFRAVEDCLEKIDRLEKRAAEQLATA